MPGAAWRCAGDGGCVPSLRVCVCVYQVCQRLAASTFLHQVGVLFSSVAVLMVVRLWVLGGAGGDGSGVP